MANGGESRIKKESNTSILTNAEIVEQRILDGLSDTVPQNCGSLNDRVAVPEENRVKRGRLPEHPCWELMQRMNANNSVFCRICSKVIMWANTHNAMKHFRNCHPEIADGLEQSWQMKLQLRADATRLVNDTKRGRSVLKKRGRMTEHPGWKHFHRIGRKSANCKHCGLRVAYACSGNLMKHLKSRHIREFLVAQSEWNEVLEKKRQMCEIRMLPSSEDQSPSDYTVSDPQDDNVAANNNIDRSAVVRIENDRGASKEQEKPVQESSKGKQAINDPGNAESNTSLRIEGVTANVTETSNKIFESMVVANSHLAAPNTLGKDSCPCVHAVESKNPRTHTSDATKNAVMARRISAFLDSLSEDLAMFPLEKSLFCMRQIRKFMDEKILGIEGEACMRSFDSDANAA